MDDLRRPWAGLVARLGMPTVDGRVVQTAYWLPPIPVFSGEARTFVGAMDALQAVPRSDGGQDIYAVGWVELPGPSDCIACGVDLTDVSISEVDDTGTLIVIQCGQIHGLTLYDDGSSEPAWPECEITIYRGP